MTQIKTMADCLAMGETPDILFWVGCAGSFDDRAKRISKAFSEILTKVGIKFAILGQEEACTGDPAKRAGNEFLFQMMAYQNIQVLNGYEVKRIVTACPHCFNTLKNEYPELGGNYEVIHHTQLLQDLIDQGKIKISDASEFKGKRVTYHDSCYLGRANDVYEAPRSVLAALDVDLSEMGRSKKTGLCCGAGGAQMFKEEEHGTIRINAERAKEALDTKAEIIVANCPFCTTMLEDGVKSFEKQDEVKVLDIVELLNSSMK
jgi:heterodisulfide reductase subunit D